MTEPAKCHCGSISWERNIEESRCICASCKRPLWQPIETAPRDGRCFIGYFYHADQGSFYQMISWDTYADRFNREPSWLNSCNESWGGFTHWMPIPEAPKE
jgi:hypothetical protein